MLKIIRLKNIFNQYKQFFTFLLKFVLFYVVFIFVYKLYLSQFDLQKNEVDGITKSVAYQTQQFMLWFENDVNIVKNENEPSIKMIYKTNPKQLRK